VNFVGIGLDVEQGKRENAKKQLQAFTERLITQNNRCQSCHKIDELKHYVESESIFSHREFGRKLGTGVDSKYT